jgi:FkbM family methyltransferase
VIEANDPATNRDVQLELISYGQNSEDVILYRAFKDVRNGRYVDVGAGHPKFGSISKNLYERLDWSGVDIEPLVKESGLLASARPRNRVLQCAIGSEAGQSDFYRLTDNWGMSTLDLNIANAHRRNGWNVVVEPIEVRTLESVLTETMQPEFELLKIDVEGRELDVLQSFDITEWLPQVVLLESTLPASTVTTDQEWEYILLDAGYVMCLFDGLNRFYCSPMALDLAPSLSVPANVFDRYIFSRWWDNLNEETRHELDLAGRFID